MRWFPIAVALCLAAGAARAEDQEARDRAFEQGAAAEAEEARRSGLGLPSSTTDELARVDQRRKERRARQWGLALEGGAPTGATASLVYRPVSEVRLWAGPAWNYVAWGVQAGVTLVPWHMGVSPILTLEAGRYFSADATFLAGSSGIPPEVEPLLKDVSYDFAAAHIGIEVGTRDGLGLFVLAGLSYVSLTANGTTTTTASSGGGAAQVTFTDPHLRGTIPSVKLGVQLWF